MRSTPWPIMLLAGTILLAGCTINKLDETSTEIVLKSVEGAQSMRIDVEAGPQWTHQITPGPFRINILPQLVIWMESREDPCRTLFINGASGEYTNHATKKELGAEYFQRMLPVWSQRLKAAGGNLPTTEEPYTDGLTSATPHASFSVTLGLASLPDSFSVYCEINKSMDHNDAFPEREDDWIGQPSIIYKADIVAGASEKAVPLVLIGRGPLPDERGRIISDLDDLDTALELLKDISIRLLD